MTLKILLIIPILLSLVMISVSPAAADSSQNFKNILTVGNFCGVDLGTVEADYGSLGKDEISASQTIEIIGTGNTDIDAYTYATNWLAEGTTDIIIPGNYTTFDWDNDGVFGNNLSLNKTDDFIDMVKTIPFGTSIDSYWQVEVHIDAANDGFKGKLNQFVTFEGICV